MTVEKSWYGHEERWELNHLKCSDEKNNKEVGFRLKKSLNWIIFVYGIYKKHENQ